MIPFKEINKALAKEFGKGNVEIRPGTDLYYLHFKDDYCTEKKIKKATKIVGKFIKSVWFLDAKHEVKN